VLHRGVVHRIHIAGVDHSREHFLGLHPGRGAVAAVAAVGDSRRAAGCMGWGHSPMEVHCNPVEEVAGHNHLHRMNPEEVLGEGHHRRAELPSRPWCHRNCRWHPA
jgi:hypothetical protein